MFTIGRTSAAVGAVLSLVAAAAVAVVTTSVPAAAATTEPKIPGFSATNEASYLTPLQHLRGGVSPFATLESAGLPWPNGDLATTTFAYRLVLQPDGNLVEYRNDPGGVSVAVWSTRTTTGKDLYFQSDHNVVLYDGNGHALWSTGTAGSTAEVFQVYGNGEIVTQDLAGRVLTAFGPAQTPLPGVFVATATSPRGTYRLDVQSDGNLVEYAATASGPKAVWSTGTVGSGPVRLAAQSDGNLVLYQIATGRAVWNSHTHGPAAYYQLDVQDDANVVLYLTDGLHRRQAVWASYTRV